MRKTILSKLAGSVLTVIFAVTAITPSALAAGFEFSPVTGPQNIILSFTGTPGEVAVTWWDVNTTDYMPVLLCNEDSPDFTGAGKIYAEKVFSDIQNRFSVYTAVIRGISAGGTFRYAIETESGMTKPVSFTMPAEEESDFSFLYLGDVQASGTDELEAWGEMTGGAYEANPDIKFGIIGGDLVNNGQTITEWQALLGRASGVFSRIPLMTVPGNHESNHSSGKPKMYTDLLNLPENGPSGFPEEFYSFDYGDAYFLMLNSNVFLNEQLNAGSMTEADFDRIKSWMASDLAASDAAWKIVVMHHPAYEVVGDSAARKVMSEWAPVFEKAQVDLVFCGHQHVYMRTEPMYENRIDHDNGITYVMGNSGSKFYPKSNVFYSAVMLENTSTYQVVNVSGGLLEVRSFDKNHELVDSYTAGPKNRPQEPESSVRGDIDGDNAITRADVRLVILAILGRDYENMAMDVDENGVIDIRDAHLIALMCG